jgi:gamma-glutamyltranspeptidase/glutathione hydrolase
MTTKSQITFILCLLFLASVFPFQTLCQDRLSGKNFATRSEVIAKNGMAATSHPLATQIAIDVLKQGGTAVDAAIAANAFLGFADPAMNGVGGDLFAIVWDASEEKLHGLNASGRSPKDLQLTHFREKGLNSIPASGPLPITVPGCVDGWVALHDRFGKLPFSKLLEPAIQYANEGIGVTQEIADMMVYFERLLPSYDPSGRIDINNFPEFQRVYRSGGRFPQKGEVYKNPDLAVTLRLIAEGGRDVFYKGEIGKRITRSIQDAGGFLSMSDLENHTSIWVEPVSTHYRGYEVWELPPNSQGMTVLQILNILEEYDLAGYGFGSVEHIHLFSEAKKLAYADRAAYYGDYDFAAPLVSALLSKDYAHGRKGLIDMSKATDFGPGLPSESHTTYITCADKEGNMISLIQSNSWLFGSLLVPEGLGFCLQNRGTGFNFSPGHINVYAPGKRPFHTIIPAFITRDGKPYISFGLTGGDMQPQGHVQIIMNIVDFGMNLQEAGDAPRIRHEYINGQDFIRVESGFDYEVIRDLMQMGHHVSYGFERYGGYQAILFDGNFYYGASESRKDGQAGGY